MKKPTAVAPKSEHTTIEKLTGEIWDQVADNLKGTALSWWQVHKDDLIEMGKEEAKDVFEALRRGDTFQAKLEVVGQMSRKEWLAYRHSTSGELQGIAARRHRLLRAIETIAIATAKTIGNAVASAF